MRIELLPGLTNVIRFPVERRAPPTLDLLRGIAPDPREVGCAIEAFGLDDPTVGLRDAVDASTAEHILNQVPGEPGQVRLAALDALLSPLLAQAVTAPAARRMMRPWSQQRRSSCCSGHRQRVASGCRRSRSAPMS